MVLNGTGNKYSKYVLAFPKTKATGNEAVDEDKKSKRLMAMTCVDHLVSNLDFAPVLYTALMKQMHTNSRDEARDTQELQRLKKAKTVSELDEDFCMYEVTLATDLTTETIADARAKDPAIPRLLYGAVHMLTQSQKLPANFIFRSAAAAWSKARREVLGPRLQNIEADGGILASGALDWKYALFVPTFGPDSRLTKIKYTNGDELIVDDDCPVKKDTWVLQHNWLDFGAHFQKAGSPNYMCHDFFVKDKRGPHREPAIKTKADNQKFETDVDACLDTVLNDVAGDKTGIAKIRELINDQTKDKKRKASESARAAAKTAQEKIKKLRTVQYGTS